MIEKQLKLLYDVKLAIDEIESFFQSELKSYENYKKNTYSGEQLRETLRLLEKR